MPHPSDPDRDELAVKERLITLVDGPSPAAQERALPPKPTARPRDWLDDILDADTPAPAPAPAATPVEQEPVQTVPPPAPKPKKTKSGKGKKRRSKKGKQGHDPFDWHSPRQSLLDAYDRTPPRLKWLAYHATAGYMGWSMGLVDWSTYVTRWIVQNGFIGVQSFFWYGAAALTFLLYRRTRRMWLPVAWLAAVPATSTVIGVLLYAPTS